MFRPMFARPIPNLEACKLRVSQDYKALPRIPPSTKLKFCLIFPDQWSGRQHRLDHTCGLVRFCTKENKSKSCIGGIVQIVKPLTNVVNYPGSPWFWSDFGFRHWKVGPNHQFSLRSCRSSSVIFFDSSQGNLAGNLWDFFWPTGIKAEKLRGKFRSIFRKEIRSSKKTFVQNSLCRRATLTFCKSEGQNRSPLLPTKELPHSELDTHLSKYLHNRFSLHFLRTSGFTTFLD